MAEPTRQELEHAAAILRGGGLVAFPTETVYGLGANALDAAAVAKIYAAKGRPANSPLIVHVGEVDEARELVSAWPEEATLLAGKFWPGPLTIVLPKAAAVPDNVTAGLGTVGLRMPAHPVALDLIEMAGVPVAAPSANKFTQLSPTTAEHVRVGLGNAVDAVLDGGPTVVGIESTVVSLVGEPVLLRPGMISLEEIEEVIGHVKVAGQAAATAAHESPGMHARHYSPKTPIVWGAPPVGRRAAYMWIEVEADAARSVRMPLDPKRYAAMLYATLHELDAGSFEVIAVEPPPADGAWAAIHDRLRRAAHR